VVLHANELGPAILLGDELHLRKLYCPHRTCTNVVNLAALDKIMERLHSLFKWGIGVEAVDLKQIDVVGIKALEGGIYCIEYRLARKTTLVGIVPELW
jgi:hypothetical protein